MTYFFETETTCVDIIKQELEEMAGIIFFKNDIMIICEYCNKFTSSQNITYQIYFYYPERIIKSEEIKRQNVCEKCKYKIKMLHKIK
jgi:hypothetical protein